MILIFIKFHFFLCRLYDSDEGKIVSRFWKLQQIFERETNDSGMDVSTAASSSQEIIAQAATAEHLFKCIENSFDKYNINFKNVIGFASDGCNTMMGINNSVASRFRDRVLVYQY